MAILSVNDVTKTYGEGESAVTALDGLSLEIPEGETFGLLGTNGAGKSTLFKLLVGHLRPDSGTVEVAGRNVADAGPEIRREVGFLPEYAGFDDALTGREVLEFHARMRGLHGDHGTRIADVLDLVGLTDAADREVGGYSNGMNRRLGLATAVLSQPRILLLDEPTAGLDPLGVARFHRVLTDLKAATDLTVVVSSHVLGEIEELCDAAAILHDGTLRAAGSLDDLRDTVADGVSVHVRVENESDLNAAVSAATDHGSVRTAEGRRLVVHCDRTAVTDLLDAIDAAVATDAIEVTEPGLYAVFENAVADEGVTA